MNNIVIFEAENQPVQVRLEGETVWLGLQQLAELFERDKSVISRHLRNIFNTNELQREPVVAKNATAAADGKRRLLAFMSSERTACDEVLLAGRLQSAVARQAR